jgi:hypothetical protein
MNQNQAASFIAAQSALLNCRVAAMVAENQHQIAECNQPIFIMEDFKQLQYEFEPILGYNAIYTLYDNCER